MLDTATKRRIDTARDILVGKVPDPKSQVEQITIALIYKFMDDMDAESEELGGKRKFFTGDYARYGWAKLMAPSLGGHEMLACTAKAFQDAREPRHPRALPRHLQERLPALPRPRDAQGFLKIIDEFSYDHSERLGDAFEYLLSASSAARATPASSARRATSSTSWSRSSPRRRTRPFSTPPAAPLASSSPPTSTSCAPTPTPRPQHAHPRRPGRLAKNFKGYDISPDMVRLSLVNLYLHGFTDPHIYEYDTLTSEERWNEFADVILANPPFMSPKGGIKPHKRFSIQAKRSEVLFVDYMAEHLTPTGRAAIIVPVGDCLCFSVKSEMLASVWILLAQSCSKTTCRLS
jgi:type I restriction enzyme M protein